MGDMAADRVYDERREETVVYVAAATGLATVRVAGDRVGQFALARRCTARDVAAIDGRVYVATPEGVLAGPGEFDSLGFADATAVGTGADGVLLAADESGAVARYGEGEWTTLGTVGAVRAVDGGFVAAADGVYRVAGDGLAPAGLDDARDVAAAGVPLAATGDGLYRLGNGWLRERAGAFETVAAGADGHADSAHAATADTLYRVEGDDWTAVDLPVAGSVADVAYGECVYAVTRSGTFLVDADPARTPDGTGGWRHRSLGLPDVAGLAVV